MTGSSTTSPRATNGRSTRPSRSLAARGVVLVLAIFAGQLQNAIQSVVPGLEVVTFADDLLIAIAFVLSLRFFSSAPLPVTVGVWVWLVLCSLALLLTTTFGPADFGTSLTLFRQIAFPAILLLIGATLRREEWLALARLTIALALLNSVYVLVEVIAGPLVDPTRYALANGYNIYADGYPSTYHGNNFLTGERIIRAGGLLLNPPTMSLFVGVGVVLAAHILRGRFKWASLVILVAGLYATNGRSGIVLAAVALVAPPLFRAIGGWASALLLVPLAIYFGARIAEQGASDKHLSGLIAGLRHALGYPLGRGYGHVGNSGIGTLIEEDGGAESLLGIAFSAIGLSSVIVVAVLVVAYARLLQNTLRNYAAGIGLGIVIAALLVESASALNGTVPIWLAAGVAFSPGLWPPRVREGPRSRSRRGRSHRYYRLSHRGQDVSSADSS